jgi:hypothetical protein
MAEPLSPEVGQKASRILASLLDTQAFGEKKLELQIDAPLAGLLLALNEVNSTYARLRGDSRLALATRSAAKELERLRTEGTPAECSEAAPASPDGDDFFDAAEVENIERTIAASCTNGEDQDVAGQLRALQEGLINFLVTVDTSKMEGLFRGNFGHVFRALVKRGNALGTTAGPFEIQRIELEKAIAASVQKDESFDYRPLLARMLCGRSDRGAIVLPPERLPPWLRSDYSNYCECQPAETMSSVRGIDPTMRNRTKKRRAKPACV